VKKDIAKGIYKRSKVFGNAIQGLTARQDRYTLHFVHFRLYYARLYQGSGVFITGRKKEKKVRANIVTTTPYPQHTTRRACRNRQALRYVLDKLMGKMCLPRTKCLRSLVYILGIDPENGSVAACASRHSVNGRNVNVLGRQCFEQASHGTLPIIPLG